MEVHVVRTDVRAPHQCFERQRIFITYKREVLVYFVSSMLSGGNLSAYITTTSTFMATKLPCELFSFYFPLLLRLANDIETNPVDQGSGPRPGSVFTVRARTCKASQKPFVFARLL